MEYIRKTRMEDAANMLKFSDYPIQRIAEYYQFETQTHSSIFVCSLFPAGFLLHQLPSPLK